MTENKDARGQLEPWMNGPCEVKANGYVYPCEVINRSVLGKENYLIRILLPNNGTHSMVVTKNVLMSRAHYNSLFDGEKQENQRREEFLYPIGSFIKTKFNDKKVSGRVTRYNSATGEYSVSCNIGGPVVIRRLEKELKLDKKAKAASDAARVNEMIVTDETKVTEGIVPNREKTIPEVKVTVTAVPKIEEEKELPFKPGDRVEVRTSKTLHGELWVPATITRQDTVNPYTPMSGSRWFVKFPLQSLEWSYPADKIKKIASSLTAPGGWSVPKEQAYEEKFKTGNTVEIINGIFEGQLGSVLKKYVEVVPLKKNYWVIDMHGSDKERIIAEENLKLYTPEKPKTEDKPEDKTEDKTETIENEIVEVISAFFEKVAKELPIDVKKFTDLLGPIREYKGKGNRK